MRDHDAEGVCVKIVQLPMWTHINIIGRTNSSKFNLVIEYIPLTNDVCLSHLEALVNKHDYY